MKASSLLTTIRKWYDALPDNLRSDIKRKYIDYWGCSERTFARKMNGEGLTKREKIYLEEQQQFYKNQLAA